MADPKSVAPYACLPLKEEIATAATSIPDSFSLPRSFPADLLTEEQLDEVRLWFDTYISDLLATIRAALTGGSEKSTLAHLLHRAVILAHLLRLHPAAEDSITALAEALGISRRAAFYIQDDLLTLIRPALCHIANAATAMAAFASRVAEQAWLDFEGLTTLSHRQLAIPFKRRAVVAARFATAQAVAALPGVAAVREDFMPGTTTNALFITLTA